MPSLSMQNLRPLSDPTEFEKLLVCFCRVYFQNVIEVKPFGRQGQKQKGIDVVVVVEKEEHIVVQCKDVAKTSIKDIDKWVRKFDENELLFAESIRRFVIAVGTPRNSMVQEYVFGLSHKRFQEGQVPVEIIFWDDIQDFIKSHDEIIDEFYPQLSKKYKAQLDRIENQNNRLLQSQINHLGSSGTDTSLHLAFSNEEQLMHSFLEIVVKYDIQSLMRADPETGFDLDLIMNYDLFEIEAQAILDKAVCISDRGKYDEITAFLKTLKQFVYILLSITDTVDGIVRIKSNLENEDKFIDDLENCRNRLDYKFDNVKSS